MSIFTKSITAAEAREEYSNALTIWSLTILIVRVAIAILEKLEDVPPPTDNRK